MTADTLLASLQLSTPEIILAVGGLVLLMGTREIAWGASILAVRVWPADDYTRVTLESDTSLAARHFMASNPARLVIDVDGLELSPALRELVGKVASDDPYIAGVRVGQNRPRIVRLVIDLKQPTAIDAATTASAAATHFQGPCVRAGKQASRKAVTIAVHEA